MLDSCSVAVSGIIIGTKKAEEEAVTLELLVIIISMVAKSVLDRGEAQRDETQLMSFSVAKDTARNKYS